MQGVPESEIFGKFGKIFITWVIYVAPWLSVVMLNVMAPLNVPLETSEADFLVICEKLMNEQGTSCELDKYEPFWHSQSSVSNLDLGWEWDGHELGETIPLNDLFTGGDKLL